MPDPDVDPKLTLKDLTMPTPAASETPPPSDNHQSVTVDNAHEMLKSIAEGTKEATPVTQEVKTGPVIEAKKATQAGQEAKASPAMQKTTETVEKTDVNNPEQTAEQKVNKEKLDSLFTQSAKLFLDKKEPLVVTVALARASGETPLGTELRQDVAQMISEIDGAKLEPQAREQLIKIQEELRLLNIPKTDAARSEFANTLEAYAAGNPDKGITPTLVEQVRTNTLSRPDGITSLMKTDSTLTARLMTELNGDPKEPFPNVGTPEGLVKAAGLDMTPENHANATEILRPKYTAPPKETTRITDMILPTALATSMTLMFIASLAGAGGEQGGH